VIAIFTFILLNLLYYQGLETNWLYTNLSQEIVLLCCWGLLYSKMGRNHPEFIFLLFSWSITLIPLYWYSQVGIAKLDFITWTLVFLGQATLLPLKWRLHLLSQLGTLTFFLVLWLGFKLSLEPIIMTLGPTLMFLYLLWFCIICDVSVYLHETLQYSEFKAKLQLQSEQNKSERLLLNILPASIIRRLKQKQTIVADNFSDVTVLFADIVGFTEMSGRTSPTKLLEMLNDIFSMFDTLVEQYELEKIKTIGDAYMVVAGLPEPCVENTVKIADLALEMHKSIVKFNELYHKKLQIRIGIHTGPAIAGVIGIKKFAYDLWGDTVNTASRMESHGVANKIQVSDSVYEELKADYLLSKRGKIQIKGKGEMVTYFLEERIKSNDQKLCRSG
ncbi:adenylate/guanylate cyclase domain-containing protein, partial [Candidatus Marithioploca araucensis]|nr:adenylate/guanylate cyclase domain-containing protein [Candidatus Marithioploca araucensis]